MPRWMIHRAGIVLAVVGFFWVMIAVPGGASARARRRPEPPTHAAAPAAGIQWYSDWATAEGEAGKTHKLVMVDFYTDWCTWCQQLATQVYPRPEVIKAASQFVPLRLNADGTGKSLAEKYKITSFPTIAFLDPSGALVEKIVGYEAAPDFASDLDRICRSNEEFPGLQAEVRSHPDDTAAAVKLALDLIRRGRVEEAQTLIGAMEKQRKVTRAQLLPVYDTMGDYNLGKRQVALAIPWYQKAMAVSTDPVQTSTLHVKLGICYVVSQRSSEGQGELKAALNTPGAPDGVKHRAREILAQLQRKH